MTSRRSAALLAGWLALLALLAVLAFTRLAPSGDLRLFMPAAQNDEQRLLLDSMGEGPGARVLLLAIGGAPPEVLAELSRELADTLADEPLLRRVGNGDVALDAVDEALLPYRYLLSPTLDTRVLDADFLRAQLRERLQDLGSPAAGLVEPWIGRDPTLEVLRLAEGWQPANAPETFEEVWFDPELAHALLVAETAAAGFDPDAQRATLDALHAAFDAVRADAGDAAVQAQLEVSGPGAFSVLMRERTQGEATRLGLMATLGMVLLLGFAYRSARLPLLAALPLASGILAGLAAVSLLFDGVHGITLAFGITLIGIAQDYPIHLFSHRQAGELPRDSVRRLWPTMLTGVLSTCLAFLSFVVSGVEGLRQLAAFSVVGLLTAALCTRFLLPGLLPPVQRDPAEAPWTAAVWSRLQRLPAPGWAAAVLALLAASSLLLSDEPLWDDGLAGLTPVPAQLLARDGELRGQLGVADVRHVLAVEAADIESLLARSESLEDGLQALVALDVLEGFELPSGFVPSAATQRARQARLPDAPTLAGALDEAGDGLAFRAGVFAAFQADVANARTLAPLLPDDLVDTLPGARLAALLPAVPDGSPQVALVSLVGVRDTVALEGFAERQGDSVRLLDLRAAAESLASVYRERVLYALAAALVLLALALWLALRSARRMARVLLPVLLAGLAVVAVLHALGIALNLFHLVAWILAAGLGLDYALFFERARADPMERRRTLHAVLLCACSTGLVFGLLATSSIPVLRAIGFTVALGVVFNMVLAALIAGRGSSDART